MADTPHTNIEGYRRAMDAIRSQIGPRESPQSWLAERLELTRQACHQWERVDGIPSKYVEDVAGLTGLSPFEIRPSDIAQNLPGSIFDRIAEQAKRRGVGFGDVLLQIIKKGLK